MVLISPFICIYAQKLGIAFFFLPRHRVEALGLYQRGNMNRIGVFKIDFLFDKEDYGEKKPKNFKIYQRTFWHYDFILQLSFTRQKVMLKQYN